METHKKGSLHIAFICCTLPQRGKKPDMELAQFQQIGHSLADQGLVYTQSGNLSMRKGQELCITRRGSILGNLTIADLVYTGIFKDDQFTMLASSELGVHRAIYKKTGAEAIVHAHPAHTIALSFAERWIIPCDMEGQLKLCKVPVIGEESATAKPGSYAGEIADALSDAPIIVVRSHGSFAIGKSLDEALDYIVILEQCCHILYLRRSMRP